MEASQPGSGPRPGGAAPLVLVAEDSRVLRSLLRGQLRDHGYRVVEAHDGAEAVNLCRKERPDVVLLDVEMPLMDGHLVLASLKRDPLLAEVPVVFVTARVTSEDVVQGLELGAHDYLRKPFEASELLAASTPPCGPSACRTSCGCATPSWCGSAAPTPSPACTTAATSRSGWSSRPA